MAQERTRSFARVAVDRIRQDRGLGLLTAVAMVAFVVLVYVVVVIGVGALLGRTGSPSLWLSVLATAIVAIAFEPVRRGRAPLVLPRARPGSDRRPTRCSPDSRRRSPAPTRRRNCPPGWPRCWPRAPAPRAPRSGWSCTVGWNWRRAGRPTAVDGARRPGRHHVRRPDHGDRRRRGYRTSARLERPGEAPVIVVEGRAAQPRRPRARGTAGRADRGRPRRADGSPPSRSGCSPAWPRSPA